MRFGVTVLDDDDTVFGFNLGAGVGYNLTDSLTLEAMYRYVAFMDAEVTANGDPVTSETTVDAHVAEIGLRFKF